MPEDNQSQLQQRALALRLHGLLAHWDELVDATWVTQLLDWETEERARRSLDQRLRSATLGRFTSLVDFNWDWPKQCDRAVVEELMSLQFIKEGSNAILVGPNGVGKSTIAKNIAYQAVLNGYTVRFGTASAILNELAQEDSASALSRRLKRYIQPALLVIDEVGYLSYGNRHADLLFEIVSQRYDAKSIIITTNKPFAEWNDVFPNASCVVTLVDRLLHKADILSIEGESYRLKEANERAAAKKEKRAARRSKPKKTE